MVMRKFITFSIVCSLCAGCVPQSYDYEYISLDQIDGIEILEYGRPEFDQIRSDKDMPTKYRLNREGYTVILDLDTRSTHPAVFVSAESMLGSPLNIEPAYGSDCGSFYDLPTSKPQGLETASRYEWAPAYHPECMDIPVKELSSQQVIAFNVFNDSDTKLGEETLGFQLKTNGHFTQIDAL